MLTNRMHDMTDAALTDDQLLRYSRHIMLDDIGEEGQQRLCSATALLVGLGGLGSPAAMYLAAAGIGALHLCDDDTVELSNLQRQIIHSGDSLGQKKTASARARLNALNPHCAVKTFARVTSSNVDALVEPADIVIDGSDNYATRHLINRACVRRQTPLVFGAAVGFDGQVSVFDTRRANSPCYNCLFSQDDAAEDVRCALLGVLAPLTGIIGAIQAAEAIKCLAAAGRGALIGRLLLVNARDMQWRNIALQRDPQCAVCHAR